MEPPNEQTELLAIYRLPTTELNTNNNTKKLSIFFGTLCVIDLFGVFPIISLPNAIISCGLYGVPLMIIVVGLQIYTATILGRCWIIAEKIDKSIIQKNRYPYSAIGHFVYGKYMGLFVTILLDLTVFTCGIPNLLVASENLELLGLRISDNSFDFSFCYWLLILGFFFCPLMLLGSPKNMRLLAVISVAVVISVTILTWICIFEDEKKIEQNFQNVTNIENIYFDISLDFPSLENLLKAYSIISFQFDIHPLMLTIQVDMEQKNKIGNSVFYGILFTGIISIITTLLATYKYGTSITPNLLEILPQSWFLYLVLLLVTVQLCLSSVVSSSPLFQHIEDVLGISRNFTYKRFLLRSILVILAITIAELVPRFDLVMGLIGGSLIGPLIFILPPLFYTKMIHLEEIYDEELRLVEINQDIEYEPFDDGINIDIIMRENSQENLNGYCLSKIYKLLKFFFLFILPVLVIVFGLSATVISTYCNLFDFSTLLQWNPCLNNANFTIFQF